MYTQRVLLVVLAGWPLFGRSAARTLTPTRFSGDFRDLESRLDIRDYGAQARPNFSRKGLV